MFSLTVPNMKTETGLSSGVAQIDEGQPVTVAGKEQSSGGWDWLDNIGSLVNTAAGAYVAVKQAQHGGEQTVDSRGNVADQPLTGAKSTQNTSNGIFARQNMPYIIGGGLALAALAFVALKR